MLLWSGQQNSYNSYFNSDDSLVAGSCVSHCNCYQCCSGHCYYRHRLSSSYCSKKQERIATSTGMITHILLLTIIVFNLHCCCFCYCCSWSKRSDRSPCIFNKSRRDTNFLKAKYYCENKLNACLKTQTISEYFQILLIFICIVALFLCYCY